MDKQWYQLTFKSLQPLHIGMGTYGVLSPTNIYIPGKTMWGALTRALGEKLGQDKEQLTDEQSNLFAEISNFYPYIDDRTCFPNYKKGEFHLGDYSEKKFRYLFTDTFVSTAIKADSQSAMDESLHEMELLLPRSKEDSPKDLLWRGMLRADLDEETIGNEDSNDLLKDFLVKGKQIRVGGEQKYGYGLMELTCIQLLKDDKNNNETNWNLVNGEIVIADDKNLVHSVDENSFPRIIMGERELWYETIANSEKKLSLGKTKMTYRPGCKVQGGNELKLYKGVIVEGD